MLKSMVDYLVLAQKPADWGNEDVPSIESILNDIKTLPERARHLTDKDLEKK